MKLIGQIPVSLEIYLDIWQNSVHKNAIFYLENSSDFDIVNYRKFQSRKFARPEKPCKFVKFRAEIGQTFTS